MTDLTKYRDIEKRLRATAAGIGDVATADMALHDEAADAIEELVAMVEAKSDLDKVAMDSMLHGTGVMKDGKHIPLSEFYAPPDKPE